MVRGEIVTRTRAGYEHSKIVRVRKETKCYGCNRLIPAGVEAEKSCAVIDGTFYWGHWCVDCSGKLAQLNELREWCGVVR